MAGCVPVLGAPPPETRAVLDRYCLGCHNSRLKSASPEVLEKGVRKLRARFMPPAGLPRPDERTYDAVVSSLAASLDNAAASKPNPGRTDTFRRLNRTEYQNSIRDLLALDVDV